LSAFAAKYKARYGFDMNFLGETGYTAAQFVLAALDKAGRDLTLDSFIRQPVIPYRGAQWALGAGGARTPWLLTPQCTGATRIVASWPQA
jgi:hypothetical protein